MVADRSDETLDGTELSLDRPAMADRVVRAWVLVAVTAAVVALAFDYDRIWWGAVLLYAVLVVDLAEAYLESRVHGRDAETLAAVAITVGILYLHSLVYDALEGIAFELGAAQVVALAALAGRGYAIIRTDGSLRAAAADADPVTHPFITVGAAATFLLGLVVLTGWSLLGSPPADPGSPSSFFLVVTVGSGAGLFAYLLGIGST